MCNNINRTRHFERRPAFRREVSPTLLISFQVVKERMFLSAFDCSTDTCNVISRFRTIFHSYCISVASGLSRNKRAVAVDECKPTTTAMCLAVVKSILDSEQQGSLFKSTVSNSRLNYFKHSSTDEAIFELSQHLRLLSTLREYATRGNNDARNCNRDLTVLLCHLYLPICPREPLAERLCIDTLSPNSTCFKAVKQFNDDGHDLKWPPVEVNCQDRNWFSPNATLFNGMSMVRLISTAVKCLRMRKFLFEPRTTPVQRLRTHMRLFVFRQL